MKNVNIEELVQNVPTMDLAKALITSFLQKHPRTLRNQKDHDEVTYHLGIWVHDMEFMDEPEIRVETHVKGEGFTAIATDWSEWRELSTKRNVTV